MPYGRPRELDDPKYIEIGTDRDTRDVIDEGIVRKNFESKSSFIRWAVKHVAVEYSYSCLNSAARPKRIGEPLSSITSSG